MNFPSVSGKNWLFRKFDSTDVTKFSENHNISLNFTKFHEMAPQNR